MDNNNYYFIENMTGDSQDEREDEREDNNDAETFVAGYEADGSIIEGFAGKKKLKKKLRRARRRARRAENQLANTRSASYWDGWWNSNYDNDYYNRPIVYSQPVYVPVSDGGNADGGSGSNGGASGAASGSDMPWVIFAGLVFVIFVVLMIMLATRN